MLRGQVVPENGLPVVDVEITELGVDRPAVGRESLWADGLRISRNERTKREGIQLTWREFLQT
jgi:hypothetical protein